MKKNNILAHRGWWLSINERNSKEAFIRAFDNGFGIETDLRDYNGKIVISHDMPSGNELLFEELMEILDGRNLCLGLNIKADGLGVEILRILNKFNHTNYFTFDMSIPDMVCQHKLSLKVFTGISDIMPHPVMFDESDGVWLDSFNSDWFDMHYIQNLLFKNKKVCVVSPDLHGRDFKKVWDKYKSCKDIMMCTDFPMDAWEFFNE